MPAQHADASGSRAHLQPRRRRASAAKRSACLLPLAGGARLVDGRRERRAHDLARLVAATRARRARSPARAGCRRSGRLLGAGEHGQPRRARRPARRAARCARRRRRRAARVGHDAGRPRASSSTVCACLSARLSSTQRTTAPARSGSGCPVSRQNARDARRACRRAATNDAVVRDRRTTAARGASAASATSSSNEYTRPSSAQTRRHSCSSQRPVTLRRSRVRPGDAALVRQVGREGLVGDQRLRELDADERPRADAEIDGAGPAQRHGRDRGRRVVRRDGDHARAEASSPTPESAEPVPGDDLRQQPDGDVEALEQVGRPAARARVEALRRASRSCARRRGCRTASSARGRGSAAARRPSRAPRRRAPPSPRARRSC